MRLPISDQKPTAPGATARLMALLAFTAFALCSGCVSSAPDNALSLGSASFGLVSASLDRAELQNRGDLPTFDPQPGGGGAAAFLAGELTIDQKGLVLCKVQATELSNPTNPRARTFEYRMVDFNGTLTDDTRVIDAVPSDRPPRLGEATRLWILSIEEEGRFLTVQAATGDRRLPYIYRFRRSAPPSNLSPAPTL